MKVYLIIVFLFSFALNSTESAFFCKVLLETINPEVDPKSIGDFSVNFDKSRKAGAHGGKIVTLRRVGKFIPWLSNKSSHQGAMQGDPRWFIKTFGAEIASFFGFKQVDPLTLEVPDALELSRAIEKVNQEIAKFDSNAQIPISFYPSYQERVKVDDYLKSWQERGQLPLATNNMSMIHDISYHAPSILIPPQIVELSRLQTKYLKQLTDYLESTPATIKDSTFDEDLFQLKMLKLGEIDEGTANTVMNLNISYSPIQNTLLARELSKIAREGASPFEFLQLYLYSSRNNIIRDRGLVYINSFNTNPDFRQGLSYEVMKVACLKIIVQIENIKKAVNSLLISRH